MDAFLHFLNYVGNNSPEEIKNQDSFLIIGTIKSLAHTLQTSFTILASKMISMDNRHQVHNLIILDESGSMTSIRESVISGFNELVETIKGIESRFPEQAHFISLVSFNGGGRKTLHWKDPVSSLARINATNYQPREVTPLFDAMGDAVGRLKSELQDTGPHNVLVTIFTDGEENASKEFSGPVIKKMVEELKKSNWTFTYIGTDHDVEGFAISISITNTLNFKKNQAGMNAMIMTEKLAREEYSQKIRRKEDTSGDFYKE